MRQRIDFTQISDEAMRAIAQEGRWRYAFKMARTQEKVSYTPPSKDGGYTPVAAASGVEERSSFWKAWRRRRTSVSSAGKFTEFERGLI
jgi:hypothetical protein